MNRSLMQFLRFWWRSEGPRLASARLSRTQRRVELPEVGEVTVVYTVNCIGDSCPRPQLLTLRALDEAVDGEVVELISDNPASVETISALMLVADGQHLATLRNGDVWEIYLQKGCG